MLTSRLMQENLPDTQHPRRKAERRSRNVGKTIGSLPLQMCTVIMGCDFSLEWFQAQPKWEIPVNNSSERCVMEKKR